MLHSTLKHDAPGDFSTIRLNANLTEHKFTFWVKSRVSVKQLAKHAITIIDVESCEKNFKNIQN